MHDDVTGQSAASSVIDKARAFIWKIVTRNEWDKVAEAYGNMERIDRIPRGVLPESSPARQALVALALRGHDVDAYTPVASTEWRIWCRPAHPSMQGRYTVAEWLDAYEAEYNRIVGAQDTGKDGEA